MDFQLYQIGQINQLFSSLNLSELGNDICNRKQSTSTSSPRREDTEMLEEQFCRIEISPSNASKHEITLPLIRIPHNINDHYKISWQIRDKNHPVSMLMSERFPQLDCYLQEYATLMGEKNLGLSFIQIYPHSLTLLSQRRYRKGQKILQIGGQWLIGDRVFSSTRIRRYLGTLQDLIQNEVQIEAKEKIDQHNMSATRSSGKSEIYQAVKEGVSDESVLYLFELKFVMGIEKLQPPSNRIEQAQWLYFQLLPKSFDYLPFYHTSTVAKHHEFLSSRIQEEHYQYFARFFKLCKLLKGTCLKKQFTFETFLMTYYPSDIGFYQKYMHALSFQNYSWCQNCEKARIYQRLHDEEPYSEIDEQFKGKKAFLPILDQLQHSQMWANVEWSYERGVLTLLAKREINCGDILYIKYNQMPVHHKYLSYGLMEVDSDCYLDIFFNKPQIVIDILEVISERKLSAQAREIAKLYLEEINLAYILQFRSSLIRRYGAAKIVNHQASLCMTKLIQLADDVCGIQFGAKHRETSRVNAELKNMKGSKLKKIQLRIKQQIYRLLEANLKSKMKRLSAIQKEVEALRSQGGQLSCSKQYTLMCLYSLISLEIQEHFALIDPRY